MVVYLFFRMILSLGCCLLNLRHSKLEGATNIGDLLRVQYKILLEFSKRGYNGYSRFPTSHRKLSATAGYAK